jgi:hypothetical protein
MNNSMDSHDRRLERLNTNRDMKRDKLHRAMEALLNQSARKRLDLGEWFAHQASSS